MENVKRICWDCPNEPVTDWKVNNVQERREGHLQESINWRSKIRLCNN